MQTVSGIEEEYGIGVFHTLLVDVGADVGHRRLSRLIVANVEGKKCSVDIGGIEHDDILFAGLHGTGG